MHLVHYLEAQVQALEESIEEEAQKQRYRDTVAVLGAFYGIALLTALTLAFEIGDIRRFAYPIT